VSLYMPKQRATYLAHAVSSNQNPGLTHSRTAANFQPSHRPCFGALVFERVVRISDAGAGVRTWCARQHSGGIRPHLFHIAFDGCKPRQCAACLSEGLSYQEEAISILRKYGLTASKGLGMRSPPTTRCSLVTCFSPVRSDLLTSKYEASPRPLVSGGD
jgi:hypothetical protein